MWSEVDGEDIYSSHQKHWHGVLSHYGRNCGQAHECEILDSQPQTLAPGKTQLAT